MTSIAKQNTIEALTIYHKAQTNKWEVRVTDGNIRIASWTDKFSSVLNSIFNPSRERTDWNEKAKRTIEHKLFGEVSLFQEKIEVKSVTSLLDDIFLLDIKKPEPNFKSTLENSKLLKNNEDIKQLWEIKDKKIYGLIVEELMNTPNSDLRKARNVAEQTIYLIKEHSLQKSVALKAARNCCIAMENKYADNFKAALDLVKFSGELVRKKKIEESSESIELAYYSRKFMTENNLHIDDAVLCAKSLKGIKADKQIKNNSQAMEIAVTRLNKMKEFQKITPHGLPLKIDGSTTEFNLEFSHNGKKAILDYLNNPMLYKIDEYGINSQFTADSSRQHYKFKIGKSIIEYNDFKIQTTPENKEAVNEASELLTLAREKAMIDGLKTFANDDVDLTYGLSLIFDQSVGNAFVTSLLSDFIPKKESILHFGVNKDYLFERGDLDDKKINSIKFIDSDKIQISYEYKQKINYITDPISNAILPIKNINNQYEIEGEYTVEYSKDKIKEIAIDTRKMIDLSNSPFKSKKITINSDVKLIKSSVTLRINPDWDVEIKN